MFGKKLAHRLSPRAESDLEEIWLYTFRQWSVEQADAYHRSLVEAIEGLASGRIVWQKSNARKGYWKYPVGRHVIFFRNPENFLDVIRILHEEMDMDQHLDIDMDSLFMTRAKACIFDSGLFRSCSEEPVFSPDKAPPAF